MKIKSIEIINFKAIEHKFVAFEDGKILTLIGPNGIGKTSFIEALRYGLTGNLPQNPVNDRAESASVAIVTEDGTEFSRTVFRDDRPSKVTMNGRATPAKNLNAWIQESFGFGTDILKIATSADILASMKSDELSDFLLQYIPEKITVDKILGSISDITEEIQEEILLTIPEDTALELEDITRTHEAYMETRKSLKKDLEFVKGKLARLPEAEPERKIEDLQTELEELLKREGAAKGAREAIKLYEDAKKKREASLKNIEDMQKRYDAIEADRPNPIIREGYEKKLADAQKRERDALKMMSIIENTLVSLNATLERLSTSHCPLSDDLVCTTDKTKIKEEILETIKSNEDGRTIQKKITDEANKEISSLSLSLKEYDDNSARYKEKLVIGEQIERGKKNVPSLPAPPSFIEEKDYGKEKEILKEEIEMGKKWKEKLQLEEKKESLEKQVGIYDFLCKAFAPKGEVMTKTLASYLSLFEEEMNKRAELLRTGMSIKFAPENGVKYFVKVKGEKAYRLYDELSRGEKTISIFLLLDLVSSLCGTKIMILDDLNNLDKTSLEELFNLISTPEFTDAYDNIILASVENEEMKEVCEKHKAVIQI